MVQEVVVLGVGIKKLNARNNLVQINPNPASKQTVLAYQIPSSKTAVFKLYGANGRAVYQSKLEGNGSQILNTAGYAEGVCFYEVLLGNKVVENGKLIVVR